ncbi:transcription factor GTE8-like isoform X2 [Tasmannia lanceolata]|uniref:transcription factor GTE8-like isoform X2 n=1 Tax=Tasmannia lanceolata TaxID=3420 RepID=UPI0040649411
MQIRGNKIMTPTVLLEYAQKKESKKFLPESSVAMMGKTQKFTRLGYSSGFVPDHGLADEIVGESEGFGSSGRVDTGMTASEDSCAPKRKCISLNIDRRDGFEVPSQIFSVSKMSRSERKERELKLRAELDQVRVVMKKIVPRCMNGVALSSSSDIRDGQKRLMGENFKKSVELSSGQGKKRPLAPLKRSISGRFESVNHGGAPCSNMDATLMKQCEALLKKLMSQRFGWVFNAPVNVVELNIPDYFTVIKNPMDLGTVKSKIVSGAYSSPLGFAVDVRLTFSNAMTYNPPGNDVHIMADTLRKFFELKWKSIEKKIPLTNLQLMPAKPGRCKNVEPAEPLLQPKKRKLTSMNNYEVKMESWKRTMTDEERQNLSRDLDSLQGDIPEHIIDFLREHSYNANQTSEDEIEVDIDALSDDILYTLRKLLDGYLQEKQANKSKVEPCEMEILNDSGPSNSSMQPFKGNYPADEDVDICGNDPPVSSYPTVEIENDTALRSSKCSSSSSSSSDSDSSSSESDSGGSSGSESDGAKVSSLVNTVKDTIGPGSASEQEKSDLLDPHNGNQSRSGLEQDDQNSHLFPISVEADNHQEGEKVSPEKLYRAALLRNRFADTILKAREKTLSQGEKGDPEKLRRKREELERQQREEKARLQAEAKAAEDARRRAEVEAASEARRKRELEREAARLALQKMEKSVEINGNGQFLIDLEMLGSAPAEHLPSSVDETSPDHSQDAMGFKLMGSNPLEQLGLYMKEDEEDEEFEPDTTPVNDVGQVNEVEEGEID